MAGFSLLRSLAVLSLFCSGAFTQTTTPTQTWTVPTPGATCKSGLANQNDPAGSYTDQAGMLWQIQCNQQSTGGRIDQAYAGGLGVRGCFQGCERRIGCTAIGYNGDDTGVFVQGPLLIDIC